MTPLDRYAIFQALRDRFTFVFFFNYILDELGVLQIQEIDREIVWQNLENH